MTCVASRTVAPHRILPTHWTTMLLASILPPIDARREGLRMSVTWKDSITEIAGAKMHLSRAGSGKTVLVLHHDIGTLDRLPFYDSLAERFDVLVPHHHGWGKSQRPEWLPHPRDT